MSSTQSAYDVIIVGAGVSGSFIGWHLAEKGVRCLMLEAGSYFHAGNYPTNERDSNSRLYWGGGLEFNTHASIGLLRPRVVGGGSIVNQALLDRFDDDALDSWTEVSGIDYFNQDALKAYYDVVDEQLVSQEIPAKYRNGNARIFEEGFRKNGFQCAPLVRAQKDCKYEDGNDCIECLGGCRIDSKQSTPVTVLKTAMEKGLELVPDFDVTHVEADERQTVVRGRFTNGETGEFKAKKLILAAGAIGNPRLLKQSGFRNPLIGSGFYTHPQHMVLAEYDEDILAHKGAFQAFKSNDPNFRKQGFKLENVFAPPVAIAMLIPGFGSRHQQVMEHMNRLACIEVAVRDTNPGKISINKAGKPIVSKSMNRVDMERMRTGQEAIRSIFRSTGAKRIIPGIIPIGLHLMGGCAMGTDAAKSVVNADFQMHENPNIFMADGSIFPNAPGINPSMTIMALSVKAADAILTKL
jgi:choline dehydrogenase-like flavoprotein